MAALGTSSEGECNATPPSIDVSGYWQHQAGEDRNGVPSGGKWMMFYKRNVIDAAWERAQKVYNDMPNTLAGMKVSTALENPLASNPDNHVIIFYCGPAEDEPRCALIGEELVQRMQYGGGYAALSPYITYKPDRMTRAGVYSGTGRTKPYTWRVRHLGTEPPPGTTYWSLART